MALLTVLNVSDGDTQINFDPANEAEAESARVAVESLLRAGHLIFALEPNGKTAHRVEEFDASSGCYIVTGQAKATADTKGVEFVEDAPPKRKRGRPRKRVPASTVTAVSVGRSAGGFVPPAPESRVVLALRARATG